MSAISPIRPSASTRTGNDGLAMHFLAEELRRATARPDLRRPFAGASVGHRLAEIAGFEGETDVVRLAQPGVEMRHHVQQHFVAIGDQQRAGSPLQLRAARQPAPPALIPIASATASKSGSCASRKASSRSEQAALTGPRAKLVRGQSGQGQGTARRAVRRSGSRRARRGPSASHRGALHLSCGLNIAYCVRFENSGGNSLAKILVVEDNALNIKLFCDLLTAHGHETEPVTDSREALEAARAFKPDLVITDIQLPFITGIELATNPWCSPTRTSSTRASPIRPI